MAQELEMPGDLEQLEHGRSLCRNWPYRATIYHNLGKVA
jgi:hypothetical protein